MSPGGNVGYGFVLFSDPICSTAPLKHRGVADAWKQSGQFTFRCNSREINFSLVIIFKIRKQKIGA